MRLDIMNTRQLNNILSSCEETKLLFSGVFPLNRLNDNIPQHGVYICNSQPDHMQGQHWLAIGVNKTGGAYYFDSYGLPPHHEQIYGFLCNFKSWKFNRKKLQNEFTAVCGQYCVLFAIYYCRDKLYKMFDLFAKDTIKNDTLVSEYVSGMFKINAPLVDLSLS